MQVWPGLQQPQTRRGDPSAHLLELNVRLKPIPQTQGESESSWSGEKDGFVFPSMAQAHREQHALGKTCSGPVWSS